MYLTHLLTFSSFSSTSDPSQRGERPELPCGVTESIEFICLLILSADFMFRVWHVDTCIYFIGLTDFQENSGKNIWGFCEFYLVTFTQISNIFI